MDRSKQEREVGRIYNTDWVESLQSIVDRKSTKITHISTQRKQVNSNFGATCDFSCALHHQPVCGKDKVLVSLDMD